MVSPSFLKVSPVYVQCTQKNMSSYSDFDSDSENYDPEIRAALESAAAESYSDFDFDSDSQTITPSSVTSMESDTEPMDFDFDSDSQTITPSSVTSMESDTEPMPNWGTTHNPHDFHNLNFVLTKPELICEAVDYAIHEALHMDFESISQLITVKLIQTEVHCWCCAIAKHSGVLSYPTSELAGIVDGAVQQSVAQCGDVLYSEGNEYFLNRCIFQRIEHEGNCDLDDVFCICDCCL